MCHAHLWLKTLQIALKVDFTEPQTAAVETQTRDFSVIFGHVPGKRTAVMSLVYENTGIHDRL